MTFSDIRYLLSWQFIKDFYDAEGIKNFFFCIFGTLLYCISVNIFILPLNLYSGGFLGFIQVLLYLSPIKFKFNMQGILYFIFNIPLFIIGHKVLGKKFILMSFFLIIEESILLSLIPVVHVPLIDDMLTNCFIGGGIQGLGCGLTFLGFGSSGGTDIVGMIIAKKNRTLSVGNVGLIINVMLYSICAYLFNFETAIYSAIVSLISSLVIDKIHLQNNNVEVNILSDKSDEISKMIIKEINRSTTILSGIGGYTKDKKYMIVSIMSEYELGKCKEFIHEIDDNAFVFVSNDISVIGNYEKRLNKC